MNDPNASWNQGIQLQKLPETTTTPLPVPQVQTQTTSDSRPNMVNNITVSSASGNPQDIARTILDAINNEYKSYQANVLA